MKKILLVLFLIIISFQSAYPRDKYTDSKNVDITIYPLSLILSRLSVEMQIGVGNNSTLVPYFGSFLGFKLVDVTITSYEFELSYRYILAGPDRKYPKFEGFYVAPVVGYGSYTVKRELNSSESVSVTASGYSVGFDLGYQFVWGNFTMNMNTGLGYNSMSGSLSGKDSEGNDVKLDVGQISGFGWRGIGFGIGFLF